MELLQQIITATLIPLLPTIGVLLALYLQKLVVKVKKEANIKDESLMAIRIDSAHEAIEKAILATAQTYVDVLKDKDAFDPQAQQLALRKSIETAKLLMSESSTQAVQQISGDVDAWLKETIEAEINRTKKSLELVEASNIIVQEDCPTPIVVE